jgi:hypothetical protein
MPVTVTIQDDADASRLLFVLHDARDRWEEEVRHREEGLLEPPEPWTPTTADQPPTNSEEARTINQRDLAEARAELAVIEAVIAQLEAR